MTTPNTPRVGPRADMFCRCGSLLSATTGTCVRGAAHCPIEREEAAYQERCRESREGFARARADYDCQGRLTPKARKAAKAARNTHLHYTTQPRAGFYRPNA